MAEPFNRPAPNNRPAPPQAALQDPQKPIEEGELVVYFPGDGDPATTKWRGVEFKSGIPVRVTNKDHIAAARANRFYRVGNDAPQENPNIIPAGAMEYRAYVMRWMEGVSTVEQLVRNWARDRDLRAKCEVGYDDIMYLGTLIEPKLRQMRLSEGLSDTQVCELWIKHGILDLPWRA
jgi:hypothetical protein